MDQNQKKLTVFGGVAMAVLLLDQLTKTWIRTTPELHRFTIIEGWLAFNFTQNPGMAMGISLADTWVISLIAIFATAVILVYVWKTMKPARMGYMVCMGLIVGGALGNISDRLFMARVGGYGGVLDGHVVDFIHFKLNIGGYDVFPYIFNVADSAISVAIVTLIVFYKKLMPEYSVTQSAENGDDVSGHKDSTPGSDSTPDSGNSPDSGNTTDPDSATDSGNPPDSDNTPVPPKKSN